MRPSDGNILMEFIRWQMSAGLRNIAFYRDQQRRIEPLSPLYHLGHGHQLVMYGEGDKALAPLQRAVALAPALRLHTIVAWIMAEGGWTDEALRVLDGVAATPSNDPHRAEALFLAAALRGNEAEALRNLSGDAAARLHSEWDFLSLAGGHARLGRTAEAISWLRRAVRAGCINYPFMNGTSRLLAPLRGHPDFQALMADVKPRWEAVVAWERGLGA